MSEETFRYIPHMKTNIDNILTGITHTHVNQTLYVCGVYIYRYSTTLYLYYSLYLWKNFIICQKQCLFRLGITLHSSFLFKYWF